MEVAEPPADAGSTSRDGFRLRDTSLANASQRYPAGAGSTSRDDFRLQDTSLAKASQRSLVDRPFEVTRSPVRAGSPSRTNFLVTEPRTSYVDQRRDVTISTPIRKQSQPIAEMSFGDISIIQNDDTFALEDLFERFNSTTILFEESEDDEDG